MSEFAKTADTVKGKFSESIVLIEENETLPFILVKPEIIADMAGFLKDELDFDFIMYITAKDYPEGTDGNGEPHIVILWHFFSYQTNTELMIKADVARQGGRVPSIAFLYEAAEWLENETSEMFGVTFEGHPNPRRMLTAEWFTGNPMLKDYENEDMEKIPTQ